MPGGAELVSLHRPGKVVGLRIQSRAHLAHEPSSRNGILALAFRMIFEGNSRLGSIEFSRRLDALGCDWSIFANSASFFCLSHMLDDLLLVLIPLLEKPDLDSQTFERLRREQVEDLRREYDDSEAEGYEILRRNLFRNSLSERNASGTVKDLLQIQFEETQEFARRMVAAANLTFYVCGEFAESQLMEKLGGLAENLPQSELLQVPPLTLPPLQQNRRLIVVRDRQQSAIVMGHTGIERRHADYLSVRVADQILGAGNGLHHRLGKRLREELGLCYSVSADMAASAGLWPGLFTMSIGTADETVELAVSEMLGCLKEFLLQGPTQEELDDARAYLDGSRCFLTETCSSLLRLMREQHVYALPLDWMDRETAQMKQMTVESVRQASLRVYRPQDLVTVIVGASPGSDSEVLDRESALGLA